MEYAGSTLNVYHILVRDRFLPRVRQLVHQRSDETWPRGARTLVTSVNDKLASYYHIAHTI